VIFIQGYRIERISKQQAQDILSKFHYLSQQGFSFRSGFNYGLFYKDILIGVAIYHTLSVPETAKGCFGLKRTQQQGIYELGRLTIDPNYYKKNLTSWFLSRTIKMLKKETNVRAILSYADSDYHVGYIYQATNFKYYGLTAPKKDFWILQEDGTYKKHQRGKIRGLQGEWRPRSRKHKYLLIFDKRLKCKWKEQPYPKGGAEQKYNKDSTQMKEIIKEGEDKEGESA
jgi:hypothetical protein